MTFDKRAAPARRKEYRIAVAGNRTVIPDNRIPKKRRAELPASPCLSPFSLSVVDHYADETENDESRLVSLGPTFDKRGGQECPSLFFACRRRLSVCKNFFRETP